MIQLSYTRDSFLPNVVYFNPDWDGEPEEYHHHFYYYEYLNDSEAIAMLEDEFVTDETKKAIKEALKN